MRSDLVVEKLTDEYWRVDGMVLPAAGFLTPMGYTPVDLPEHWRKCQPRGEKRENSAVAS